MMAVQAILAVLYERAQTGTGDRIEVPMLDVTTYFNFADLFTNRVFVDHQPEVAQNLQMHRDPPGPRPRWLDRVRAGDVTPDRGDLRRARAPRVDRRVLAHPNQHALATAMFDTDRTGHAGSDRRGGARVLPCRRRAGGEVHHDGRALRRPTGAALGALPRRRVARLRAGAHGALPGDVRHLGSRLR